MFNRKLLCGGTAKNLDVFSANFIGAGYRGGGFFDKVNGYDYGGVTAYSGPYGSLVPCVWNGFFIACIYGYYDTEESTDFGGRIGFDSAPPYQYIDMYKNETEYIGTFKRYLESRGYFWFEEEDFGGGEPLCYHIGGGCNWNITLIGRR